MKRGSEWRRWDLHTHTPGTLLNDQFGSWEEYLAAVEASDVKVLGATDYMCLDNYSKLKGYRDKGRIKNIELLLPNLEFRLAPPSEKATAVNIHLLVSPDDLDHEKKIREALGRLNWKYNGVPYSCLPDQLRALGKAFDPSIKDDRAALQMGVMQFKIDFTAFRDWLNAEGWLRRHCLVAVDAGKDGLSSFSKDGGWAAHRDEITRFAEILFSGRPGEREFWLGMGSDADKKTVARLGGPRSCVHGSDAHGIAKLFKPSNDRFCWIKADPTFEGLRQIQYEPGDRVFIGPTPPIYHDMARVVSSVKLAKSGGWFDDVEIPLNLGLVSIIGQKGSGKSALAEAIAFTAGSWDDGDPSSFLSRARTPLAGLEVELRWGDGRMSSAVIGKQAIPQNEVRYLSQNFVEHLCSGDAIGEELVKEIESVVFSYIDPAETMNASSFGELRALRTESVRRAGNEIRDRLNGLIREEVELQDRIGKLKEKNDRIKALGGEKEGLRKQIPKPADEAEKKLQKDLSKLREALAKVQVSLGNDKLLIQRVADLKSRLSLFSHQMTKFYQELVPLLTEIGVPTEQQGHFKPEYHGDIQMPLADRLAVFNAALAAKEGATEGPAPGTVKQLQGELSKLQKLESADKARQALLKQIQERLAAISVELARLEAEVKQIKEQDEPRIKTVRAEQYECYAEYFANLGLEQSTLVELYEPVKAHIASSETSDQEKSLEFSVRWEANLKTWLEKGEVLLDQRKTLPYGSLQGISEAANEKLVPAWTSGDANAVKAAMNDFLKPFREVPSSTYLRAASKVQDVRQWMFNVDHIQLSYGLKYNGVELEKLSPGTKGIVLLILYLGMDVNDTRPLIVDQPDENLDNESIFQLLTTYFKQAKRRRQIVLITHNPNLVVNTDAEQIIVAEMSKRANGLPHTSYASGALEDANRDPPGIRENVCRILEGGSDAFLKREKRYALRRA